LNTKRLCKGGGKLKPDKENVAERLKLIRKDLGWTIEMMANRVGLTKGTFNSYLRGLALPPKSIVEKIAEIGDVSIDWIYHGDIKEFIESYLISKGYEEFLKDFPKTVSSIYLEYEKQRFKYSLDQYYPHEVTIRDLFNEIYLPIFKVYVNGIANEFANDIEKYSHSEDRDIIREKYLSRVRNLVNEKKPSIRYGEVDKIFRIAEMEYNSRIESNTSDTDRDDILGEDFLDFMIRKLRTSKGTLEIISIITSQRGLSYDISSMQSDQIIEVFKGIIPRLIEVKEENADKND